MNDCVSFGGNLETKGKEGTNSEKSQVRTGNVGGDQSFFLGAKSFPDRCRGVADGDEAASVSLYTIPDRVRRGAEGEETKASEQTIDSLAVVRRSGGGGGGGVLAEGIYSSFGSGVTTYIHKVGTHSTIHP